MSVCFILSFSELVVSLKANSADPDQTPRDDLGRNCLPMSHLWDARLKWVEERQLTAEQSSHISSM